MIGKNSSVDAVLVLLHPTGKNYLILKYQNFCCHTRGKYLLMVLLDLIFRSTSNMITETRPCPLLNFLEYDMRYVLVAT
jgi:hypothetical protein